MPQVGAVNPFVPDAYVQVIAPPATVGRGVVTNLIGVVGTAPWGPVNSPIAFSSVGDFAQAFGAIKARKYDMGSAVKAAVFQGASNFRGVRVTDGTDAAATIVQYTGVAGAITVGGTGYAVGDLVQLSNGAIVKVATLSTTAIATFTKVSEPTSNTAGTLTSVALTGSGSGATFATWTYTAAITFTSKYTGTAANADTVTLSAGSAASSYKVTVQRPGQSPEVFDNITGAANALWVNIAAAINSGLSGLRGPSGYVVASAGASTAAPVIIAPTVLTLAAGSDGTTTITGAVLVGSDTGSRTGMYALRGIGPAHMVLADCDDSTTWAAQTALALAEGFYALLTGPAGEYTNPTTVAANKATAAIDSYAAKVLVGDWIWFTDYDNGGVQRLISPQGWAAGRLAALGPEQSGVNKPIQGLIGTQSAAAGHVYSTAELTVFGQAGLDLITSPNPGGTYYGLRFGQNSSSSRAINGDNYSRSIPYLSTLLGGIGGQFVGRINTPDEQNEVLAAFDAALFAEWRAGRISNIAGTQPYSNRLDNSNALAGVQTVNSRVQLGPIVMELQLNLQAGQTVQIDRTLSLAA